MKCTVWIARVAMSVSQKSSAGCGKIWWRSGYAGIAKFCWQKVEDHAGKAGRKYR